MGDPHGTLRPALGALTQRTPRGKERTRRNARWGASAAVAMGSELNRSAPFFLSERPYLNLGKMAKQIADLLADIAKRKKLTSCEFRVLLEDAWTMLGNL